MNKKGFLFLFFLSLTILFCFNVVEAQQEPPTHEGQQAAPPPSSGEAQSQQAQLSEQAKVIQEFNDALIAAMKGGKQLGYAGRYKLLELVIDKTFAMAYMGKSSLGRYWKPLSAQEQKDFLALYREWSIAQYAENFDEYDEQSFKIVSESKSAREIVTINSDFTKAIGDVIEFNYKLRQFKGQWRIVDIMISGVSQLANTRS
ncbi:MAG TPA: ABC transporter substrate-binding protein, partial [Thermodesulfovibrionia bacterium]|nr:ABC transporter substrate-binding protein [Thermodesulfovibrionia bacterium]